MPLDELKIDQSFIHELLTDKTDAAIVDTTILLAVSLGLTVVAEGVEKKSSLIGSEAMAVTAIKVTYLAARHRLSTF
ncbi:hypothetical protein HSBAA_04810 [Vreelandella sulfidaeris]|uniref:EAL domain-containing protein n=1 Tax=Vreelandella sulfidaeris TaxID=115553 RepID=A0A455U0F8_9GAMM|nr:hypothetical protein HSBAA_04810 [Halomonas sulfidaeris]